MFVFLLVCASALTCLPVLVPLPQLLEYVGKGNSIMDVGLAQARQPLTTRRHYYELEIVDAGEKCYIALGLARRVSVVTSCSRLFMNVEIRQLTPVSGLGSNACNYFNGFMF